MEHLNTLHSLCEVLGVDFKQTVHEVHPSLGETDGSKNLSNSTIESLASAVNRLRELKVQRMQKVSTLYITSEISIIQRSQPYFLLLSRAFTSVKFRSFSTGHAQQFSIIQCL
jgi:hypothetical protein